MPVSCMEIMHYRYCRGHGFETHWSLRIFLGFLCNWLRCFTTVRITAKLIISPEKRDLLWESSFSVIYFDHYSAQAKGQGPSLKSGLFLFVVGVANRQSRGADWCARAVFQSCGQDCIRSFQCEEARNYGFGLSGQLVRSTSHWLR